MHPLTDPAFYAVAIPAVLIVGIGKGGFGGGLGLLGVPLLALVISPTQAAAVLLPVLCLMDLVGIVHYRALWERRIMRILFPGALAGIAVGALTVASTNDDATRLIVGMIAVGFTLERIVGPRLRTAPAAPRPPGHARGWFWSGVAGYTSFVAHAGGPPLNVYLLPQRLDKTIYVGTTVMFFALVNYAKLVPYALLGQFEGTNLATSVVLAPLAPVGFGLGILLHRRVDEVLFYRLIHVALLTTGLKLLWDGAAGMAG